MALVVEILTGAVLCLAILAGLILGYVCSGFVQITRSLCVTMLLSELVLIMILALSADANY